ncbi:MAG: acyl-CoA dehydrogenase family protein, partial [Acidimicrobiia bacterium]
MPTGAGVEGHEEVRRLARAWFEEHWDPNLTLREWWECLAESGWGFPTWPAEWYGRGLASSVATVVHEERRRAGAFGPASGIGVMMAGPTLVEHADDEQRRRFLPSMVSGRDV